MISDDQAYIVGTVKDKFGDEPSVNVKNFADAIAPLMKPHMQLVNGIQTKRRVGVLISGSGTNLQALIDHTQDPNVGSVADIVVVISNKDGVEGLKRAQNAGIPTVVISHKNFPDRESFDVELTATLEKYGVELVTLAGFMRILTGTFVKHWRGRLINIHPSLLPSFKGTHAHQQALDAGVKITGCSVHFVEEEVDAGGIIVQEAVPIEIGDTVEVLQERVKTAEHRAYPTALELIVRNRVSLGKDGKVVWNL
jgi:phosphoribosylamine--glycine ligase/phosphoribosylglycinamide formyltransferase/phosphoribosylformylglycinamidine cyclo-ligase